MKNLFIIKGTLSPSLQDRIEEAASGGRKLVAIQYGPHIYVQAQREGLVVFGVPENLRTNWYWTDVNNVKVGPFNMEVEARSDALMLTTVEECKLKGGLEALGFEVELFPSRWAFRQNPSRRDYNGLQIFGSIVVLACTSVVWLVATPLIAKSWFHNTFRRSAAQKAADALEDLKNERLSYGDC